MKIDDGDLYVAFVDPIEDNREFVLLCYLLDWWGFSYAIEEEEDNSYLLDLLDQKIEDKIADLEWFYEVLSRY